MLNSLNPEYLTDIAVIEKSINGDKHYSYAQLIASARTFAIWLTSQKVKHVLLSADNCFEWLVVDLACQEADVCLTPMPTFFSQAQQQHVLAKVKPDLVIADNDFPDDIFLKGADLNDVALIDRASDSRSCASYSHNKFTFTPLSHLTIYRLNTTGAVPLPIDTSKVTFTSGTTGEPKGVCLSTSTQHNVAYSLAMSINLIKPKHLALLPFSLLLENVAGIYAPLMVGGSLVIANQNLRGFNGCQLAKPQQLLDLVSQVEPNSMILVQELLSFLISSVSQGWQPPTSLEFLAVGGSVTHVNLIRKAHQIGLPVYQGYGLSECGSVVSLQQAESLNDGNNIGSVGEVLPHVECHIEEGQLVVKGDVFLGYIDEPSSWYPSQVNTQDLITMTENNVFFHGRQKNTLVNSFGRNISPEWLESEVQASGQFRQCIVFGDNQPYCIALVLPVDASMTQTAVNSAIDDINLELPEYAQIKQTIILTAPLTADEDQLTANGRPKRKVVFKHYQQQIEELYSHIDEYRHQVKQRCVEPVNPNFSVTQPYSNVIPSTEV